jgi:UTP--glucose-1-phosphate uridylyltransferase
MKITKAVIAAAGRGTRFLPVVKQYPKELVAILNKPQIQVLVEELLGAGIDQICIVHRHGDPSIKRFFTPDAELEEYLKKNNKVEYLDSLRTIWKKAKVLKFIPQPRHLPYGNASPLLAAKSFIGKDDFVYCFGDDLTVEPKPGEFVSLLLSLFNKYRPAAILATQEVPHSEVSRYGIVEFIEDPKYPKRVLKVIEKPAPEDAPSNITQQGRFVYQNKVIKLLGNLPTGKDNELWLADANNYLGQHDIVISESVQNGQWMTTGDPLRWLKANIAIALQDPLLGPEIRKFIKEI